MNPAFYIIPIVLIGFFVWKGIREPVFFVGIPLLVGFNRAIFLDLFSLNVPLGFIELRQEDVLFLALLVVYVLVRLVRREVARQADDASSLLDRGHPDHPLDQGLRRRSERLWPMWSHQVI